MSLDRFVQKWCPIVDGRVLVIGSKVYEGKPDRRRLYTNALGLDQFEGEGVDIVHDLEKLPPEALGLFDHVDCVSVMEHVKRPWLAAKNIERLLRPGGSILFCAPFCWRLHNYPGDYYRYSVEALPVLFPRIDWKARAYSVGDEVRKMVPGREVNDQRWLARAETVGFGVRC